MEVTATPPAARKRELGTIQAGRFLAAFAVVLFHSEKTLALPKYLGLAVVPWAAGGFVGVEFFFVLSGFVLTLAHWNELGGGGSPGRFVWKRARRVYPPLWAMIALLAVAMLTVPSMAGLFPHDPFEIVSALLALPRNVALSEPMLAVEWTLRREFLYYAWFALYLWRPRLGLPVGIALFTGSLIVPMLSAAPSHPWSFLFAPHNALFGFGMLVAFLYRRGPAPAPAALFAVGLALFVSGWILSIPAGTNLHDASAGALWLLGLGASLAILGVAALERKERISAAAPLIFLGDASYAIYLAHFPAVSAMAKIAMLLSRHVALAPLAIYCLVVLGATLTGIMFHLLIERPILHRISRIERRRTQARIDNAAVIATTNAN